MTVQEEAWLIAGLGNPGKQYARTRHNLGRMVVETFAQKHRLTFKEMSRCNAFVAKGVVRNCVVHLLLPKTYMNLSGQSIGCYLRYLKFVAERLLVVVDDSALSFGSIRMRVKGSSGGHNGLKSVQQSIGSDAYPRLRMGIGEETTRALKDHVLGVFSKEEETDLDGFVQRGVEETLVEGVEMAMNRFNKTVPKKQNLDP